VQRLLDDPGFCAQEKFDGKRMLVQKQGPKVHGINRKGLSVGLPEPVVQAAQKLDGDAILDGEAIGNVLYAFDVLELGNRNLRNQPYVIRLQVLTTLVQDLPVGIRAVHTARTESEKHRFYELLREQKKEGIVFKRLNALYVPGRPNSGGSQLKHKFYATVSAVVSKVNARRSVELRLLNCKGWVVVGNVTIPPNHSIPQVGVIVEVRYLYAFRESNSLYQPTYLGVRKDLEHHECVLSQLKFKPTQSEEG
jgi:bifunctional non-homologous end joining protein LigD